jgi:hypothetical protein
VIVAVTTYVDPKCYARLSTSRVDLPAELAFIGSVLSESATTRSGR